MLFPDETMRLEAPFKLTDRDDDLDREMNTPVERKNPPKCEISLDNERSAVGGDECRPRGGS